MCYYDQDVYTDCKCRVWGDFRRECDIAKAASSITTIEAENCPTWCGARSLASEIQRKGICLSCINGFEPAGLNDSNVEGSSSTTTEEGKCGEMLKATKSLMHDETVDALRVASKGFQAGHRLLNKDSVVSKGMKATNEVVPRSTSEIPDFKMDLDIPSIPGSYSGPAEQDISWLLALNEDINSLEEYISNREEYDPNVNEQQGPNLTVDSNFTGDDEYHQQSDEKYVEEGYEEYDEYEEYEEQTYIPTPRRSRKLVVAVTRKFHLASRAAHSKLLRAARSNGHSQLFSMFVRSLGSHSNLVKHGFDSLDRLFSGFSIHSLRSVYSFLHVAYAMSQTDPSSMKAGRCKTSAEFRAGLDTLRECLDECEEEGGNGERELFDEIISVMWDELDYGIAWFGQQTGWPFQDWCNNAEARIEIAREGLRKGHMVMGEVEMGGDEVLDSCFDRGWDGSGDTGGGGEMRRNGQDSDHRFGYGGRGGDDSDGDGKHGNENYTPSWLSIVTGSIFLIVIAFLRALDNLGEFFSYLSGRSPYDNSLGKHFDGDRETATKSHSPFQKYWETATSQFVTGIKENVVDTLKYIVDDKSKDVLEIGMEMVGNGMVSTLRDFENYVVCLSKVVHDKVGDHVDFVFKVMWQCNACSDLVGPPYRVKRESHKPYDESYISNRVADEELWHTRAYPATVPSPPLPQPSQQHQQQQQQEIEQFQMSPLEFWEQSPFGFLEQSPVPSSTDCCTSPSSIAFSRYAASASVSPPPSATATNITTPNSICSPTYSFFPPLTLPSASLPSNASPTPSMPAAAAPSNDASPSYTFPSPSSIAPISATTSPRTAPPTNRKSAILAPVGQKLVCDICSMVIRGSKSSSSKSNLLRHKKVMHDPNPVLFECDWPGCTYKQKRKDNVKAHKRKEHGCK